MKRTMNTSLLLGLTGLLFIAVRAAHAQHGDFETSWIGYESSTFEQARYAVAAELADLDNDGDLDTAIANWWAPSQVTVILNRGNGRYDAPAYYPLLPLMGALDITAADFDGDGFLDLAAPNSGANWEGYQVSILLNNGDGTFAPHKTYVAGSGPYPGIVGLAAGDFTGDGAMDLACANYGYLGQGSTITLLEGNGAGGFLPGVAHPSSVGPYKIEAGDLDGDGKLDLVAACEKQRLCVLFNNGSGFAPYVQYPVLSSINTDVYQAIELHDMDLDGDLDVLYSSTTTQAPGGGGAFALFTNLGGGSLSSPQAVPLPDGGGATDLAAADVTGDGWPDVLGVHHSNGGWSIVPGLGGGAFGSAEYHPTGDYPFAVESGDVDADGDQDAVVINRFSLSANVHRNPGSGKFQPPPSYYATFYGDVMGHWQDAADIDGDGDLDIANAFRFLFSAGGGIAILRNEGNGTLVSPEEYLSPVGARSVKLIDINGDQQPDLVWADSDAPYHMRTRINQNGLFGPINTWPNSTCKTHDLEAADMDNDGDLDVFLSDSCGWVYVNENLGDGTFLPPTYVKLCNQPLNIILPDVNADGFVDLVSTEVCVSLGNGDGTFGPALQFMTGDAPRDIVAVDFDLDGHLDLATCNLAHQGNSSQQSLSVLFGYGDGTFKPPVNYRATISPSILGTTGMDAGDVDEDGDIDLVVSNIHSNDVSLFRNEGHGTFEPHLRYGVGWRPVSGILRDFTGDGSLDLAVIVESSSQPLVFNQSITILPGNPPQCAQPTSYCTGKLNSAGGVADVGWKGSASWFAADFQLVISGALPGVPGLAFFSTSGARSSPLFGGTLCLAAPLLRLPGHLLDPTGATTYPIAIEAGMIGTMRWYQFWYRDPSHPDGTGVGLSDGLQVTFCN